MAQTVAAVYQQMVPDSPFDFQARPAQADRNAALFTVSLTTAAVMAARNRYGLTPAPWIVLA